MKTQKPPIDGHLMVSRRREEVLNKRLNPEQLHRLFWSLLTPEDQRRIRLCAQATEAIRRAR